MTSSLLDGKIHDVNETLDPTATCRLGSLTLQETNSNERFSLHST